MAGIIRRRDERVTCACAKRHRRRLGRRRSRSANRRARGLARAAGEPGGQAQQHREQRPGPARSRAGWTAGGGAAAGGAAGADRSGGMLVRPWPRGGATAPRSGAFRSAPRRRSWCVVSSGAGVAALRSAPAVPVGAGSSAAELSSVGGRRSGPGRIARRARGWRSARADANSKMDVPSSVTGVSLGAGAHPAALRPEGASTHGRAVGHLGHRRGGQENAAAQVGEDDEGQGHGREGRRQAQRGGQRPAGGRGRRAGPAATWAGVSTKLRGSATGGSARRARTVRRSSRRAVRSSVRPPGALPAPLFRRAELVVQVGRESVEILVGSWGSLFF